MRTLPTLLLACILISADTRADDPPAIGAFAREQFNAPPWQFTNLVGIAFTPAGQMIGWEQTGKVWFIDAQGVPVQPPFLDISDEVGQWNAQGLHGFAIDPDFSNNGHVYLLYTVDRHHLFNSGTPGYDPLADEYDAPSIARVTRYTLTPASGFTQIDPASRTILIGESHDTGIPVLAGVHGPGSLAFGNDGTLLVSMGDSYLPTGYDAQAETDGIIRPEDRVGPWRSQSVHVLNGKVLRIDPATGDGLPSNPFFDPAEPRAPRSRVWALGFRNPYRISIRPGTGSLDPALGDPGVIIVGDVGNSLAEELNVVEAAGQNFGWPIYEGLDSRGPWFTPKENLDAPNPLYDGVSCVREHFYFEELLDQDILLPHTYPNPCNFTLEVPPEIPTFVHTRPAIAWRRQTETGPTRVKTYTGVNPTTAEVGAPGSPTTGDGERGTCSIAGAWYTGTDYPPFFQGRYFHADWQQGWMQAIEFDQNNIPTDIRTVFVPGTGTDSVHTILTMATHPVTNDIYFARHPLRIHRMFWAPSGNQPPTAVASSDLQYGSGPLTVSFTGSQSFDSAIPSNQLIYRWDFGDGSPIDNTPDPQHTFTAPPDTPTSYSVVLEVEDDEGLVDQTTLLVSVNNTPPQVTITSPLPTDTYSISAVTPFTLDANITDAEHSAGQLTCEWETRLYHDQHFHTESLDAACSTTSHTEPLGCEDLAVYWYGFILRVTDDAGLTTEQEVLVYPDCSGVVLAPVAFPDAAEVLQAESVDIDVLNNDIYLYGSIDPASVTVTQQPADGTTSINPVTGVITYTHNGAENTSDSLTYTVADTEGDTSPPAAVAVAITIPCPGDITTQGAGAGDPGFGVPDGATTAADIAHYVNLWLALDPAADLTTQGAGSGDPGFGVPDGTVTSADIAYFVNEWTIGCP